MRGNGEFARGGIIRREQVVENWQYDCSMIIARGLRQMDSGFSRRFGQLCVAAVGRAVKSKGKLLVCGNCECERLAVDAIGFSFEEVFMKNYERLLFEIVVKYVVENWRRDDCLNGNWQRGGL